MFRMSSRALSLAVVTACIGGTMRFMSTEAESQVGVVKDSVALQGAGPGFSQSGNANISGAMRAGQFIGNGANLTNITAAALVLPFSGSASVAGPANSVFKVTNTGTGAAIFGITGTPSGTPGVQSALYGGAQNGFGVFGFANNDVGVYGLSSTSHGVMGRSDASTMAGVYGSSALGTTGVKGVAPIYGVYGNAFAATGATSGVEGLSSSSSGVGVVGRAESASGTTKGVYGVSSSTGGIGVFGETTSATGSNYALYGNSESATGLGLFTQSPYRGGETHAIGGVSQAIGFYGYGINGTSSTYAVYGNANSAQGSVYGVQGIASGAGSNLYGLYGSVSSTTNSGSDYGVFGVVNDSVNATAVYGVANSATGVVYGVRGVQASGTGYGVYASGDFGASGTKSFVIDHPADPLNKYLRHYSMEAPKPWNLYRGKVTTDGNGYAWVDLPNYYDSINADETIHLTVNDSSDDFVMAKVVGTVAGNRFKVRSSKPNVEVTWLVIADRNDPWVQTHPPRVEIDKPVGEKGLLQHPELYGYSKGMAIDMPQTRQEAVRPSTGARSSVTLTDKR